MFVSPIIARLIPNVKTYRQQPFNPRQLRTLELLGRVESLRERYINKEISLDKFIVRHNRAHRAASLHNHSNLYCSRRTAWINWANQVDASCAMFISRLGNLFKSSKVIMSTL